MNCCELALSSESQIWKFHMGVWQTTSKQIAPKSLAARAALLSFFVQPIKSLSCGVVVDVAVVKCSVIMRMRSEVVIFLLVSCNTREEQMVLAECHGRSLNPFPFEWVLRALIDFTLSNARLFYSSMGNLLDEKWWTTPKTMSILTPSRSNECPGHL